VVCVKDEASLYRSERRGRQLVDMRARRELSGSPQLAEPGRRVFLPAHERLSEGELIGAADEQRLCAA
jgi:hypothetical protein